MSIQRPTLDDLTRTGQSLGLQLAAPLLSEYAAILEAVWQDYDRLDQLPTPPMVQRYPRSSRTISAWPVYL